VKREYFLYFEKGMKRIFKSIVNAGTAEVHDLHQRRKILLLNYMAVAGIISFIILFTINFINGLNAVSLATNLTGQSILYLTLYFNYKKHYRFARWFCFAFLLVFFNGLAILMGAAGGIEFLNLLLCISAVIFFDRRKEIILIALLSLIGFTASRISFEVMEPVLKNNILPVIFSINMVILFVCSFLVIYFFRTEFQRYTGIIEVQHEELTEKSNEINASIRYAKRIQNTMLESGNEIRNIKSGSFIYYQPKDVVSGDFYWYKKENGIHFIACADCTGHGIPGAFMCMIGITLLNEIVHLNPGSDTGKILDQLNHSLIKLLKQRQEEKTVKDGMEISLLAIDEGNREVHFSGANTDIFLFRKNVLHEIKGDDQPIGLHLGEVKPFSTHKINTEADDLIYMYTDGYADQFGGPNGKKFNYPQLRKVFSEINSLPMKEQETEIRKRFENWKGDYEQLDDVCIIGVKV
jgi:phosphoserine phosphatase RsbU/P